MCEYLHSFIFNYFILFSYLVSIILADIRLDLGSTTAGYCSGSGGAIYNQDR